MHRQAELSQASLNGLSLWIPEVSGIELVPDTLPSVSPSTSWLRGCGAATLSRHTSCCSDLPGDRNAPTWGWLNESDFLGVLIHPTTEGRPRLVGSRGWCGWCGWAGGAECRPWV